MRAQRQDLHARIAKILGEQFPDTVEIQPEILAHHYTEAGLVNEAVDEWEAAAHKALAHGAQREAVGHFREATQLAHELPESADRSTRELTLLLLLGQTLHGSVGIGNPETRSAYAQARQLAHELRDADALARADYGIYQSDWSSGSWNKVLELAEETLSLAELSGSQIAVAAAMRMFGSVYYLRGQLRESESYLRKGVELFRLRKGKGTEGFSTDPVTTSPAYLSLPVWALGFADEAVTLANESEQALRGSADTNSVAYALGILGRLHILRRDPNIAMQYTAKMAAHADERGAPIWRRTAEWIEAVALIQNGDFREGLQRLQTRAQERAAGVGHLHDALLQLAEATAYLGLDRTEESSASLLAALLEMERLDMRFFEPELHRLKAAVLLKQGTPNNAEACYLKSVEIAQSQAAKSWELRTSVDLARLWRDQGKRIEAHDLLAPVYGWFQEGFDTADLKEAKALLSDLS